MLSKIFLLLVAYQIKHYLADYPLQNRYMLGKFKPGWDFFAPLVAHAGVHALFTFWITFWFVPAYIAGSLALLDFIIHFIMDRIKAGPKYLGRFSMVSSLEFPRLVALAGDGLRVLAGAKDATRRLRHNTFFWWSLGLDQMVHHLTHYIIIYIVVSW